MIRHESSGADHMRDAENQMAEVVPSGCNGCAIQCGLTATLGILLRDKSHMTAFAEMHTGSDGESFDRLVDAVFPDEFTNDVKRDARSGIASALDEVDKEIENMIGLARDNSIACQGVLKMRASKGDTTYTVSVCTSSKVHDEIHHAPTHTKITNKHD